MSMKSNPDQLLTALRGGRVAIDVLMARLIELDPSFMPTQSPAWPALVAIKVALDDPGVAASSPAPAQAPRFVVVDDDCATVVDNKFQSPAHWPFATKVLCRAVDPADAAFVAKACSAYDYLIAALLDFMVADGESQHRAARANGRVALAITEG